MKTIQEKSREYFAKIALETKDKTTVAGRYAFDAGKEEAIVGDIIQKIDMQEKQSFLDIGCGFGFVVESLLKYAARQHASVTLVDIPEVIDAVERELITGKHEDIRLLRGLFPKDFDGGQLKSFDRVILYSVLHYADEPLAVVEAAVKLLNPNGRLLLGDLPNISKKGRFLSSSSGRVFEAEYRKTTVDKIPHYQDHIEYVSRMKSDPDYYSLIDDEFVRKVFEKYSNGGYEVYVLPQPANLPFCLTREDVLICRYD